MSKKKKNFQPHKGNKVNQGGTFPFIENFNTWRKTCQGVSGDQMMVKNVPNLYAFLKTHMMNNIRAGSRNRGRDGQGAIQFLEPIEAFVDNNLFTEGQANIIKTLADTLESFYLEGNDAGGKGPARDPAFILFTEQEKTKTGQKKRPRKIQGHYATEFYDKKNKSGVAPAEWFAHIDAPDGFNGGNPPHQALFSRTKTKFANPKGLLWLMKEATEFIDDMEMEVEVDRIPEGVDEVDLDEIKSVESFFNDVVRNESFWNAGGRLLTSKVRSSLQATEFAVKPNEQKPARKITNVGKEDEKDALTGDVVSFKLTATALPIINLVDRALKRKNTNKAPNGFRAWQGDRKGGFDYRKTAREKYPDTYQDDDFKLRPDQKVISKMWQQLLWRD
tara:strand:- start:792 stop:1958 length:1167 start_codon:yes stop_codon:yes gene_type:complete